jgi:hypothetical protein
VQRARETLEAIAPALRDASLQVEDALFAADEESLLARLRTLPAETASVKLARYYPGLQDLGILPATGGDDLRWLREKSPNRRARDARCRHRLVDGAQAGDGGVGPARRAEDASLSGVRNVRGRPAWRRTSLDDDRMEQRYPTTTLPCMNGWMMQTNV